MNLSGLGLSIYHWIQKRRYYYIVFFIIAALVIVEGTRVFMLNGIESDWENIKEEQAAREMKEIQSAFNTIQNRVYGIATRAASLIDNVPEKKNRLSYFEILHTLSLDDLQGVEIYTSNGELFAWWGKVPTTGTIDIAGNSQTYSKVIQGAVFTSLSVIMPLVDENDKVSVIIAAHEAFDVQYLLSPRFIKIQGLQRDLRESLGKPVQLIFQGEQPPSQEIDVPLHGIGDALLGYALVSPPVLESYIADFEDIVHRIRSFLIIGLSFLILFGIVEWLRRVRFSLHVLLIAVGIAWGIRYVWMLLHIPNALIGGPPFDPAFYASPHGGGVVASPGDLLITAFFLIFTGLLFFHSIVINNSLKLPRQVNGMYKFIAGFGAFAITFLYMGLVRSFAASVRSLVFDSSVRFTDPSSLFPSPMLAMMQLNLLILAAGFVIFGTVLGFIALRLVQAALHRSLTQSSAVLFVILIGAALIYFLPQDNPLVPLWYYIAVPTVLITVTLLVQLGFLQSFRLYKIRSILFLTGISVVFAAPVLDRKIHQYDREQIQFIANNIIRPTDAWKEFILHQSLREFSNDPRLIDLLHEGNYDALRQQAFHLWAGSMLGREGYNSTIILLDKDRNPISRFGIGFQPPDETAIEQIVDLVAIEETYIRDVETIYGNATIYAAQTDIIEHDDEFIGTIIVNVITGPGTLFRGYGTDILRAQISPDISARYGQLIISEFKNEELISTSAMNIPSTYTIPDGVLETLRKSDDGFVWHKDRVENQLYETAFFRDQDRGPDAYLAISIPYLDFRWHIFYALKLVFFALAVSGLLLLGAGALFYAQGKRYQPTFREKILIGLLSLSLIPIIIVAYLNRDFTIDRMTENISQQLFDEAKRVVLQLQRYPYEEIKGDMISVSRSSAERIAGEMGVDFVIYVDGAMSSTSRMEMFEAELMDKRLSGFAYSNIVLQGKNFVTREEAIGQLSYLVGYLPIHDHDNSVRAVLAVPAIYRQAEIDEELARRDAFLFGIYALVMLGVIVTGLIVANRVSRPIEELTDATHRVAGGDLDIHLPSKGDSEMSNLMRSFNVMTKRLKESREELARVERELAWREMARQVAHEIKNPLTPMKLSIQQLRQARIDGSDDFDRSFDKITRMLLEQIETLDRIASEFSRFARMPIAQFEPVNVNEVLQRAMSLFPEKDGVDFQSKFDDTIPMIDADPEELQRAFVNIIRNSIQAMPDGGRLDVTTELQNETIIITLCDSGVGISSEAQKKLFKPNFSTKTDGMGLGLAIVKKTIEQLHGTVSITSQVQAGTTVTITIPINEESLNDSGKEIP